MTYVKIAIYSGIVTYYGWNLSQCMLIIDTIKAEQKLRNSQLDHSSSDKMIAKLLIFVLAIHMATCTSMFTEKQLVQSTMPKPTLTGYPSNGVIEFLNCPGLIHEEILINQWKILKLDNTCKLQANSIIIEDSIILVEETSLYLIANHVKLLRTTIIGNNHTIRIVAENIELYSNRFVGDNSTYEALGINISRRQNDHVGDYSSYKVLGSYIEEQLDMFTGIYQYHNLTTVDIQQIRNEYSEDLPIYNLVEFGTGNPDSTINESKYIVRQGCVFRGNHRYYHINAPFFCNDNNDYNENFDSWFLTGSGRECKISTNLYDSDDKIVKFKGIEYDVL
ncbi:uncharacterized protein LOC123270824 [Cotesia glomerata]|uniref:uncharacterized protein LOC123270824 n=1 Tax=Cotesia glomerata TaxID=32391 RepID=UPI001D02DB44|nr:uncharacterized protein LOC123270824 [Cotesia glomerata]